MKSSLISIVCTSAVLMFIAAGCRQSYVEEVHHHPLVDEVLLNSESPLFVDFSSYPADISKLPVGVIGIWVEYDTLSQAITALDRHDNIDGDVDLDNILDFAGEHFSFLMLRDSLSGNLLDTTVMYTSKLLQQQVKIVLIASRELSRDGLATVKEILAQSGTGVKAIGLADSTDFNDIATECYRVLRDDRHLALRITPQSYSLTIVPDTLSIEEECISQQ